MSGFKRKPLQSAEELTEALRGHAGDLPSATGRQEPALQGRVGEGGRPRIVPKTVQLNINITEELADLIADEAVKAGSTRRFIARVLRDAGYPVPQADLHPFDNRRRARRPA